MNNYSKLLLKFVSVWFLIHLVISLNVFIIDISLEENRIRSLNFLIKDFLFTIFFQFSFFAITIFICKKMIEKKLYFLYVFSGIQFIIQNIIFFTHLGKWENRILFIGQNPSFVMDYILYNCPYFFELYYIKHSLTGVFDGGYFVPADTITYYFIWFFLPAIYYAIITFTAIKLTKIKKGFVLH